MSSDNEIILYMTAGNAEEARQISGELLQNKLIACANILSPHTAVYQWEGEIEEAEEVAVIMKSRQSLFPAIQELVCALHSYECPCLVAWEISFGHASFLAWIQNETNAVF